MNVVKLFIEISSKQQKCFFFHFCWMTFNTTIQHNQQNKLDIFYTKLVSSRNLGGVGGWKLTVGFKFFSDFKKLLKFSKVAFILFPKFFKQSINSETIFYSSSGFSQPERETQFTSLKENWASHLDKLIQYCSQMLY